jgi:hypothetical protein
MKKQTNQTKQTKMATEMTRAVVRHNRWQRFWGLVALVGLFLCGYMLGGDIQKSRVNAAVAAEVPVASTEKAVDNYEEKFKSLSTCAQIEELLNRQLRYADSMVSDDHIDNAKIYANLSERGCPENSQKYVELAKQELEIARALEDDEMDHEETIEVVETYKRLKMQNAAQEILDKAKKITNPAIDFIIELEKIINE